MTALFRCGEESGGQRRPRSQPPNGSSPVASTAIACNRSAASPSIALLLTAAWAGRVVDESFELLSQGVQEIRAYDCANDIVRVERYTAATPGSSGLVVVLANDAAYWRPVSTAG
jgi:hypothetical protein